MRFMSAVAIFSAATAALAGGRNQAPSAAQPASQPPSSELGAPPVPTSDFSADIERFERCVQRRVPMLVADAGRIGASDEAMRSIDQTLRDACFVPFSQTTKWRAPAAVLEGLAGYEVSEIGAEIARQSKAAEAREAQQEAARKQRDDAARKQMTEDVGEFIVGYRNCLVATSRTLALESDEPASTIVQAAEGVCAKEQGALWDWVQTNGGSPDVAVNRAENAFTPLALAAVIGARTGARVEPPKTQSTQPEPKNTPL